MPVVKLDHVLRNLISGVSTSLSLANDVGKFKEFKIDKYLAISKSRIYLITELSFLQLFISWEQFLADTFVRYMCGAVTSSGYSPGRRIQAQNLEHALDVIRQNRPYVDWTRWDEVISHARLYFTDGEPFATALGGSLAQLDEMKNIRNRITHKSPYSSERFKALVMQRFGYNPTGMVPGKFLACRFPDTNPKTVLQEYGDLILVLGKIIVR